MHNHAPPNYQCPFCLLLQGIKNEHVISVKDDIIYRDEIVIMPTEERLMHVTKIKDALHHIIALVESSDDF